MRMYDIIAKKRDGYELDRREINYAITNYINGEIPDYQMSALLMAIYFQGMTEQESADLTMAMAQSGDILDLTSIKGIKVDKHSTGGVGDTTTLCLVPLVASLGIPIAKMSGRGLGHTGGTIDKLESIDGFHVEIDEAQFIQLIKENGLAIISQSDRLAPADRLLYSLRDVTATVNSIPLIASSIMSKKIASGADAIVLDVKTGSGAFMENIEDARKLAKTMVEIGRKVNRKTMAIISNMEQPLGRAIGNTLEIKEAIDMLLGKGPEDLTELVYELGAHMVIAAGKEDHLSLAKQRLREQIENGQALEYFKRLIRAQGGEDRFINHPEQLVEAKYKKVILAHKDGFISQIKAENLGRATMLLGAGRQTKNDQIDLAVGLILHKKVGDQVQEGEPLCTIHTNKKEISPIKELLTKSITITNNQQSLPLILETIT